MIHIIDISDDEAVKYRVVFSGLNKTQEFEEPNALSQAWHAAKDENSEVFRKSNIESIEKDVNSNRELIEDGINIVIKIDSKNKEIAYSYADSNGVVSDKEYPTISAIVLRFPRQRPTLGR